MKEYLPAVAPQRQAIIALLKDTMPLLWRLSGLGLGEVESAGWRFMLTGAEQILGTQRFKYIFTGYMHDRKITSVDKKRFAFLIMLGKHVPTLVKKFMRRDKQCQT